MTMYPQRAVSMEHTGLICIARQLDAYALCGERVRRERAYDAPMEETVFTPTCLVCIAESVRR